VEPAHFRELPPDEKRAARARWRAQKFAADIANPSTEKTLLELNTPGPGTRRKYNELYGDLLRWAALEKLPMNTDAQVDKGTALRLSKVFLKGAGYAEGMYLVAAVKHHHPSFKKEGERGMVHTREALHGWKRVEPLLARLPAPKEALALLCGELVAMGRKRLGNAFWMSVEAYLRPGELLGLKRKSLIPPLPSTSGGKNWVLSLHPREELKQSKVGLMDEVAPFDLEQHRRLEGSFRFLSSGDPEAPMVEESQVDVGRLVAEGAKRAGLQRMNLVPYSARHSGPSADRATGVRSLLEIKKRGRWGADASVRRYEQGGRILEELHKLTPAVRQRAVMAELRIADVLSGVFKP